VATQPVTKLTEEEYLARERAAEYKSEYFDGEMFAMSGASMQHGRLERNLIAEITVALRGGPCEAFTSNLRVRVSGRLYTYPDVSVVCGEPLLADKEHDVLLNPTAIFEILSPSTEKYDRGLKLQHYRTIATLQDYILVDQDQIRIEQYTRQDANVWTLRDYQRLEDELPLASIGISLPLARIYDRVEFAAS
jgi:Uma2 family endonuclease